MADALWLPHFFSSNMVLQRNIPIRLWGRTTPGESVEIAFMHHRAHATADAEGKWQATLPDTPAGGPHELDVRSGDEARRFTNVLVGDVWLCAGQSNMEWNISALEPQHRPRNQKSLPMVRLFTVERNQSLRPEEDVNGMWQSADADSMLDFSAVAFYFGTRLHEQLDVPIGLISSAWGGSQAEAWMPYAALANDASLAPHVANLPDRIEVTNEHSPHEDPGNTGAPAGWAKVDCDLSGWGSMEQPQYWEKTGLDIDGSVWFRKAVELPRAWVGKSLTLSLGAIDDCDTTYFNGHEVGAIGLETANCWQHPRIYTVPPDFERVGQNVIAVRVFDRWGNGGFVGPASVMHIAPDDGSAAPISLAGEWLYRIENALPSVRNVQKIINTGLWNAMIHPLAGLPIAGVAWYQGESNVDRAWEYVRVLRAMIRAWRSAWGQGDLPFIVVQLADFGQPDSVSASPWSELRDAQRIASENEPNVGLVVTTDLGDEKDIHPQNKRDVGLRLAGEAMRLVYGKINGPQAPRMAGYHIDGQYVFIEFNHTGGNLTTDGPVRGVVIAGDDGVYHDAIATIEHSTLRVHSPAVAHPASVRYAWRGFPRANLRGAHGLPVLPFRTDEKSWVTQNAT